MSSGESEILSLGIEFLAFVAEAKGGITNILFVDEPDVHLHPDLQDRLAKFIVAITKDAPVNIILATHSTSFLSSLASEAQVTVSFMKRGDKNLNFKNISEVDKKILPIFGAHPLSNVFNASPILLIEGEDDERIWQQAIRSSQGSLRLHPCTVDGIANFVNFESEVNNIIGSVYDKAKAFSLRDRDLQPEAIEDVGAVIRMRLACRAAENLLLGNDVLAGVGLSWDDMTARIITWLETNEAHQYHANVQAFVNDGLNRKDHDLKSIRNILVGLISNKPWEVLVGQTIAMLAVNPPAADAPISPDSLADYLGEKLRAHILRFAQPQAA
ncbi:AAA family ATPase [Mesorhizobium sp. ORM8.1]